MVWSTPIRQLKRLGRMLIRTPPWIESAPNPADPELLDTFRFYAIIGPWFEGDVIEATVKNAYAQGCERVLIVDNDSPDDTVSIAEAAGAELAASYHTPGFDQKTKYDLMNRVILETSIEDEARHIWWIWLDADEFPHGPRGETLREYLSSLDRKFRVVGARNFNHFPTGSPHYVSGFHPLEFQPCCEEFEAAEFGHCAEGHWKHAILRYDEDRPYISGGIGSHRGSSPERPLYEPSEAIVLHHFPYRDESATRRRMEALCSKGLGGVARVQQNNADMGRKSGISKRYESLDQVYGMRWDEVPNLRVRGDPMGVSPKPWRELFGAEELSFRRWYGEDALLEKSRQHD